MHAREHIGRYTLLSRLGLGAAGEVWEALLEGPVGFRKRVALKLVSAGARDVEALRHEARLGALLRHPNIVDVYELGQAADGRMFLAMELVSGPSLGVLMKRRGALPGPALRDVGMQLCRGLGYVHRLTIDGEDVREGLVHRDVKPTNVLVDPAGVVKLADLGIARLAGTQATSIEGTPGYLAPEQLDGAPPAPTADVFSAGMVLWAMAVGKTPVRGGKGLAQALRAAMTAQSTALRARTVLAEALPGLDEIVLTCLDPDPSHRFADGKELRDALRAIREPAGEGLLEVLASVEAAPEPARPRTTTMTDRTSRTVGLRAEEQAFLGRARERDAVEKALAKGGAVVTLKGMGGIGKTRLANHLCHRFMANPLAALPGVDRAVYWADVGAASSEAGFVQAVAGALHIPLDADPDGALSRSLAERGPALLVLDRVDDVLAVASRRVAEWVRVAPKLRILVTSRQPLRVPGELVVELGPLGPDEAVALFRDRAVRELSAKPRELRELVRRLDHHPLAIELVAARAGLLDVGQLLERLDTMSLGDDALERAIAESWKDLPPWSRLALVQLSAFRGTFPVQAAEAVVDVSHWDDAPWPLDLIDDLWQRSMLYVRHSRRGPRLGMSSAVRLYAVRHAAEVADVADAVEGAERRHGSWYARMGDPTRLAALSTAEGPDRVRELAADLEDLLAALERAIARGDGKVAEAVGLAAGEALVRRGPHPRAERVLRELLALEGLRRRDHVLRLLIQIAESAGRAEREQWWEEALAASPTPRRRARVLAQRARLLAAMLDEPEAAMQAFRDARDEVRASGDGLALVSLLIARGVAERVLGHPTEARESLEEAISLARRLGSAEDQASAHLSLGNLLYNLGDYEAAYDGYQQAEALFRKLGNKSSVATALSNQALIHIARADGEQAVATAEASEAIGRALGDRRTILAAKAQRATALGDLGKDEEAVQTLLEVCELARELGAWRSLALNLCNLAHSYACMGRGDEGLEPLQEAVEVARRLRSPRAESLAAGNMGILHTDAGRLDQARPWLDAAVELAVGVDPRFEGAFRSARARRDVLAGEDPSEDLLRARELLTRVREARELEKLTVIQAMWAGRNHDLKEAKRLLSGLVGSDPLLRQRIREARRFLRGL